MILDELLKVCDAQDVKANGAKVSASSIDLKKSPDLGLGTQLVAVFKVDSYTAGTNTAVQIDVIVGDAAALDGTNRVIGSLSMLDEQLTAYVADDARMPLIIRINPELIGDAAGAVIDRSGASSRYLGIQVTCTTAATAFTATCYFALADAIQGDPQAGLADSGFTVR